jgi:SAM-dependent methyltransferase
MVLVVGSPNEGQIEHWNRDAGPTWVRFQERLDAQIEPHGALALAALGPRAGERVLDVGCGCGTTSLELAARVGAKGEVVGVDISAPMLARAEERACEAGVTHLRFLQADAQTGALPEARFDAVFSRFGVMFFEEPEAAFANLRQALQPGGRLAFVSWQAPDRNPWVTTPMAAVAPLLEMPPPPPPGSPGMFGLADPERVRAVLAAAGFEDVAVRAETVEMRPGGGDVEEAVETFLEVGPVAGLLRQQEAGPALRARVREAVRDAFLAARGEEGLRLGSAVWIVTARRA